uniref:Uncharacterized protein n=1 Tax=Glossina austeni TaxID=7395 RepID=A0A1A9V0H0_GLOAU
MPTRQFSTASVNRCAVVMTLSPEDVELSGSSKNGPQIYYKPTLLHILSSLRIRKEESSYYRKGIIILNFIVIESKGMFALIAILAINLNLNLHSSKKEKEEKK